MTKQITKTIKEAKIALAIAQGRVARLSGYARSMNPYSIRNARGHAWDQAWIAAGKDAAEAARLLQFAP